jgi:hypothetical protein
MRRTNETSRYEQSRYLVGASWSLEVWGCSHPVTDSGVENSLLAERRIKLVRVLPQVRLRCRFQVEMNMSHPLVTGSPQGCWSNPGGG